MIGGRMRESKSDWRNHGSCNAFSSTGGSVKRRVCMKGNGGRGVYFHVNWP